MGIIDYISSKFSKSIVLDELLKGKGKLGHNSGALGNVVISSIKVVKKLIGKNIISVMSKVKSSNLALNYDVQVLLFGAKISGTKSNKNTQIEVISNNKKYYVTPMSRDSSVKVRCSCFTGDTLILLSDGSVIPISELVNYNQFKVFSYDTINKTVEIGNGSFARCTGKLQQIVKVFLNNGSVIKCTPDHLFMLSDGSYAPVNSIKSGTKLCSYLDKLKILSIENSAAEDVYCFNVNIYNNFCVYTAGITGNVSGIFVHNCPDFYFTWMWPDDKAKTLEGKAEPPYVRKTRTWPKRNGDNIPGVCKHISGVIKELNKKGLIL